MSFFSNNKAVENIEYQDLLSAMRFNQSLEMLFVDVKNGLGISSVMSAPGDGSNFAAIALEE